MSNSLATLKIWMWRTYRQFITNIVWSVKLSTLWCTITIKLKIVDVQRKIFTSTNICYEATIRSPTFSFCEWIPVILQCVLIEFSNLVFQRRKIAKKTSLSFSMFNNKVFDLNHMMSYLFESHIENVCVLYT